MAEVAEIRDAARPHEILLVADALTGQDAVNLAKNFNERVGMTGIVLTRIDGDARGGAALSMRAVTGKPIKFLGVGEKMDALEDFHPHAPRRPHPRHGRHRQPGREGGADDRRRRGGQDGREDAQGHRSTSTTFPSSSRQIEKMGGMGGVMGMLPGVAKLKKQIASAPSRRKGPQAPARGHLLDDAEGAPQPRPAQGLAQEADRRRRRRRRRASSTGCSSSTARWPT